MFSIGIWIIVIVVGLLILIGLIQMIVDYFEKTKDFLSRKGINYDKIEDFPILGHLKLDPELVKVIEDDLLIKLDEMYEEEVLRKLEGKQKRKQLKIFMDQYMKGV